MLGTLTAQLPWKDGDLAGMLIFTITVVCLAGARVWVGAQRPGESLLSPWSVVLIGFLVRALVAVVDHFQPLLPPLYTLDAQTYHHEGWRIAQAWLTGMEHGVSFISLNAAVYEYLSASVYFLVGESILAMYMLSAAVGALSLYYVFLLGSELIDRHKSIVVTALMAIWPSHVLWTSHNFRDPWVFYFLARALHAGTLWVKYDRPVDWLKTSGFVLLVGLFRSQTGLILTLAFLAVSVYEAWRHTTWKLRVPALAAGTTAVVGLLFIARDFFLFRYLRELSPAALSMIRSGLADGGAAFYPDVRFSDWAEVFWFLPWGVFSFLFAPLPWHVTNPVQLVSALENCVLYALIALVFFRLRALRAIVRPESMFLVSFLVLAIAAFGVVEGNVGTAFRHKMQFLPYVFVLLSPAWPALPRRAASIG